MRTYSLIVRAIIWLVSGIPALTSAQVSSQILENYIQTGLSHNLALQQQQIDWQRSLEAVRQAKSLFYPVAQFNATYTRAAGGRRIDFPIGDLLNPVHSTLNQLTQSNQFPVLANQQIQFLPDDFH
jgi:outer membrane protein TolC